MKNLTGQGVHDLAASDTPTLACETLDPDARLMVNVRDGQAAAFEELVRRYQGRLLAVLENLVGGREQAEQDLAGVRNAIEAEKSLGKATLGALLHPTMRLVLTIGMTIGAIALVAAPVAGLWALLAVRLGRGEREMAQRHERTQVSET